MRLGPFKLEEPLGRGGMGEVWRGSHIVQKVPVAIKVIAAELTTDQRFHAAFVDEVRAVARLHHPSIVSVYDHGVIKAEAEADSGGRLAAGSPYLVMELCLGRSLRGVGVLNSFSELRVVLLQLLDALAHAHARGVIHRDIKPGNVMLSVDELGDYGLKLTDFGIARAADDMPHRDHGTSSGTGTPGYMAPEQIVGDLMAQGPWTDLYAVGCLAFRLAVGQVPFAAEGDDAAVLHAHLRDPVPLLSGHFALPAGFQRWLERLMHKTPHRRFVRAADAIWALLQLGDANAFSSIPARSQAPDEESVTRVASDNTLATTALVEGGDDELLEESTLSDPATSPLPGISDAPPIPQSFDRVDRLSRPILMGVGLGLYGLRPVPLVGRRAERKAIWSTLREVASGTRPHMVLLHGASGNGKSRLAEWITQRAHELGSATVLRATHGPSPGPANGLGAMLARHFDCFGMKRESILLQLRATLGEKSPLSKLAVALTELMSPREPASKGRRRKSARMRFANMGERYAAVGSLFSQISLSRPVILWIDDAQWAADALGLAEYLMARVDLRVLILLTVRDEVRDDRLLESGRLQRLMKHERAKCVHISPLDSKEHRALVRTLLGLESELVRRVEERTAGNPLFAVQLIGDWVRRGVLEEGSNGFKLREGETAELPDDLYALWNSRIHLLTGTFERIGAAREALEIAAALGEDVHRSEWEMVCRECSVEIPKHLTGRVIESGLARRSDVGWSFCHGMLRESLAKSAVAKGRADNHHRACVAMLRDRYRGADGLSERIGHHLQAAKDHEAALAPLLDAAQRRFDRGDFDRARSIIAERERALDALGAPEGDARRIDGWLLVARTCLAQHDYDNMVDKLSRAEQSATEPLQHAAIGQLRAEFQWHRGEMSEAIELARKARKKYEAAGDLRGAADCRRIAARCHREGTADLDKALVEAQAARSFYEQTDDRDRLAECAYLLSTILVELGNLDGAEEVCAAAAQHHQSEGHRFGIAKCANQRGEIARLRGQLADAEQQYMAAVELLEEMGTDSVGPRLNLALVMVERTHYGRALPQLRRLRRELGRTEYKRAYGHIDYAMLTCFAAENDWLSFDDQLTVAAEWVPVKGRVDKDYAALAEKAAGFASRAQQNERACQALALAAEHHSALGRTAHAQKLRKRMKMLRNL